MLGLALNTSIPYTPFNEFFCNGTAPEDEVDAVTGEPRSTESARSSSSEPRVEAIWDRLTHGTLWGVLQD